LSNPSAQSSESAAVDFSASMRSVAMNLRPNWEGFLRLNLVSVPVRAFNAAAPARGKIGFHLLHKGCNNRIRYQKVCPVHGEVSKDEIVSGYEYAKGEYIVIDATEIEKLRSDSDKTITIDTFIEPDALDPLYYTERSYYLVPAGKAGQKPFAILQSIMGEQNRYAIGHVVFAGREHLVVVRPLDELLTMTMLQYAAQVKKPATFAEEVPDIKIAGKELELAESLVAASTTDDFDLARYEDTYTSTLRALIEAKAAGREIVAPVTEEEPKIINLRDALRRSLDRARKGRAPKPRQAGKRRAKQPRKAARKRKTG
jgi:DNA end-binding protein Ku